MRIGLPLIVLISALAAGSASAEDKGSDHGANSPSTAQPATGGDVDTPQSSQAAGKDDGRNAKTGTAKTDTGKTDGSKTDGSKTDTSSTGNDTAANDKNGKSNGDKSGPRGTTGKDTATNKIDTSVTVNQGKVADKKASKFRPRDKNADGKSIAARTPAVKGVAARATHDSLPRDSHADKPQRNAIGTLVVKDAPAKQDPPRSATGLPVTPPASSAVNSNAAVARPASAPSSISNPGSAAPSTKDNVTRASTPTSSGTPPPNPSVVTGTALVKPAVRTGMITGTPKPIAGVISGNTVHVKHF
jgi:hypothetical protein